jgi:hypothetical protein
MFSKNNQILNIYYAIAPENSVIEGTKYVSGVVTTLKEVSKVTKKDLDKNDEIIRGCPTYYANIPGKIIAILKP